MPDSGMFVVDTSDLIAALLGDDSGNRKGLEQTCRLLGGETAMFHNAGNDAHVRSLIILPSDPLTHLNQYTLTAMVSMAGGDQVDKQREARWPNQTQPGTLRVKIASNREDEDDFSDDGMDDGAPKIGQDPKTGRWFRVNEKGNAVYFSDEEEDQAEEE